MSFFDSGKFIILEMYANIGVVLLSVYKLNY